MSFGNTILHKTIPDRGVCAAIDFSLAPAEGSPVQCRERQLEHRKGLWLPWIIHVKLRCGFSLSAAGLLVEGWSIEYRFHLVTDRSSHQLYKRLYAAGWPHRSLLLLGCGLVQKVRRCTGWRSQSGSTKENLAGREGGSDREEVELKMCTCLLLGKLTRNKQENNKKQWLS